MNTRTKERRKCKKLSPYLFLMLEVAMFMEVAYVYFLVFGIHSTTIILLSVIMIYLSIQSYSRTMNILGRCKFHHQLY